ncbi:MAG: SgcJ/EcaC family oxidoreductase [Rubrobacteraceae bacterium]
MNDKLLIEEKVAELERAQQNESVEGFISLFTPDAVWVTAHGKRLTGQDEIHDFTKKVLPGAMKDSTASYEVVHVSFVRPDVAVVNVRQKPITHDGEPLDDAPQGSPVYVMTKEEGQWKIAAAQNTHIKEP